MNYYYYSPPGKRKSANRFIGRLPEAIPIFINRIYDENDHIVWERKQ